MVAMYRKPEILLVEDDRDAAEELSELLAADGFKCTHAVDGIEALTLLQGNPVVGVIVSDIRMPRMDGLAFITALRQQSPAGRDFQVIFVTGHAGLDESIQALKLRAVDFISKPIEPDAFRAAIKVAAEDYQRRLDERNSRTSNQKILERVRSHSAGLQQALSSLSSEGSALLPSSKSTDGRQPGKLNAPSKEERLKAIIQARAARPLFFAGELFADPCWDMILDLMLNRILGKRISVSSLCIASGVPQTTALRRIDDLIAAGVAQRVEDPADRRRVFVDLSDEAAEKFERYLSNYPNPG